MFYFLFAFLFISALISGQRMLSIDSDLGRHLATGKYILTERVIPTVDLYSYTRAGLSRAPYEWFSQVLFALADKALGLDGVILLTSALLALTFTLLFRYSFQRSGSLILSLFFVLLAVSASSIHWLPRPHIITFLLLAIWIEMMERLVRDHKTRWTLFPAVMLLWANLHGGFVFGILVWIAYFAGWFWDAWHRNADIQTGKKLLLAGITSTATTIITPDFWHNWEAVLNNRSAFILNRTVETIHPNLLSPAFLPYTITLGITLVLFMANRDIIKARHAFLLSGLGIASLFMARNIPLFSIAATPILSQLGANSPTEAWASVEIRLGRLNASKISRLLPGIVVVSVVLFFVASGSKLGHPLYRFSPKVFPVDAVSYLEGNPHSGNMFNEFNWGGYIEYRFWPEHKVFLDSQSDFYGEELMREYDQIVSTSGNWLALLDKHEIDWAIIQSNSRLETALTALGWEILYKDDTAVILASPDQ